ncbi:COP9 signalosome complex subunit 12 [Sporothrix brasiliensis 5110]|uniref:COP9 signalosome complex subunit 12 n=1 Tax=Sporothrix brasiliensis 5110 TaxID=1398154 RepID=A0A0C2FG21_9PEZI|nr:COP9 signalosome complex subunit 12 [Sporothrix brasiliensis 5110]KIH90053.1 COP9 signalosome complex subunit 12 [Sporothrix brasiliensis 5110]
MDKLFREFGQAMQRYNGSELSLTLSPVAPADDPYRLRNICNGANHHDAKAVIKRKIQNNSDGLGHAEVMGWTEVYYAYWKALGQILLVEDEQNGRGSGPVSTWTRVYEAWKDVINAVHRGYTNHGFEAWTVPCLYVVGNHLRIFAVRADEERANASSSATGPAFVGEAAFQDDFDADSEKNQQLEDCARQLNRLFQLCLSDRTQDLVHSRKWGIYGLINLLFKTYFKLNSASLSRNILRALTAYKGDMPGLDKFPRSQRVTFKYYEGVVYFLEENYAEAEKHLTEAYELCYTHATRNKEQILTYLIPCHLITSHALPSKQLLAPYPKLQKLFGPLSASIKKGDLEAFSQVLHDNEEDFIKLRIYLTVERGRDICLRNLLRKVFIAGGFEEATEPGKAPLRKTRVPISHFTAGLWAMKQTDLDMDEVECLLANMIYKNFMKGYIHHERGIVVLSKAEAFPGTGV